MCYDELTLMMYADDELAEPRHREVVAHVAECSRCGALVAALRVESRVLAEALREVDVVAAPLAQEPGRSLRRLPVAAAAVGLVALGTARVLVELAGVPGVAWLPDWLNPLHAAGRSNLFFNLSVYLVQEGEAIMGSLVTTAGLLAFGVVTLTAASVAGRLHISGGRMGALALGVLLVAMPAHALEVRRGQTVTIPAEETVDDTLIVVGETLQIDGVVNGDLIVFGRRVRVRGTVKGNLVTGGQSVEVEGRVEGSILQMGQTVTTRGQAGGDLFAFGQAITLPGGSAVSGNATTFSETATIEGTVGRDVTSFGRSLELAGMVSRRVVSYGESVDVRAGARIEGSLTAHVENRDNVRVDPDATVVGGTHVEVEEPEPSRYLTLRFYVWQCIRLAAALLVGWILFWVLPGTARIRLETGGAVLMAAGAGAVAAVATPVLAAILGVTLIGLPIAAFTIMVWLVLLYLAKILVALMLGRIVLGSNGSANVRIGAALLVGLALVIVAVNLPYVGGIVNLLLTITGFGAAVIHIVTSYRAARTPAA
jgi:cytoskeletal protein CcmA (bactofilin family)